MRQACVRIVYPKSTHTAWQVYLGKAHPGTFELALPKIHSLPPSDNPFLFIIRLSTTGTWGARYGYKDWHVNEAQSPPSSFRDYLKSIHRIRSTEKDPPNLPLLTWEEEVEAQQVRDDAQATPLKSPDSISNRPKEQARLSSLAPLPPVDRPQGVTPGSCHNAVDLTANTSLDTPHGTPGPLWLSRIQLAHSYAS